MPTRKEQATLDFIRDYLAQHGYSPTLPEIAQGLGLSSKGGISKRVKTLVHKGYLHQDPGWRGLRPATPNKHLPLLGKIAAGKPLEAIANPDPVDVNALFSGADRYLLEVKGDSMIEAGIMDGDLAVIQSTNTAQHGQIIVALIDNETASLKRLAKHRGNYVKLVPENKTMQPLTIHVNDLQIQGVLLGIIRRY